ncbi:MAG: cupin domain-containing protein [Clostridia bacterium]|nr:cupin domain-containing protein [Clostridia bacterium]
MLLNIKELTKTNKSFSNELWQGEKMKINLVSIMPRQDIGLKINHEAEQLVKIENGKCAIYIGQTEDCTDLRERAEGGQMLIIPKDTYYNIINTGSTPLKAYVIASLS